MEFVDIPFPEKIAFGAESNAEWYTDLATSPSGHEVTNQNWINTRHSFDIAPAIRTASEFALVREHFHQVRGRARSFPFKDFLDFEAELAPLTLISGAIYQLQKRYGSGLDAYDRKITRPVNGTVQVYRTRASVTSAISPSIDYETGQVTVSGHLSGDTYSWTGEFVVPARYDTDKLTGRVDNKQPAADGEFWVQAGQVQIFEVRE